MSLFNSRHWFKRGYFFFLSKDNVQLCSRHREQLCFGLVSEEYLEPDLLDVVGQSEEVAPDGRELRGRRRVAAELVWFVDHFAGRDRGELAVCHDFVDEGLFPDTKLRTESHGVVIAKVSREFSDQLSLRFMTH